MCRPNGIMTEKHTIGTLVQRTAFTQGLVHSMWRGQTRSHTSGSSTFGQGQHGKHADIAAAGDVLNGAGPARKALRQEVAEQ